MINAVHIIKMVSTVKHTKNGLMGQHVNQKHIWYLTVGIDGSICKSTT